MERSKLILQAGEGKQNSVCKFSNFEKSFCELATSWTVSTETQPNKPQHTLTFTQQKYIDCIVRDMNTPGKR